MLPTPDRRRPGRALVPAAALVLLVAFAGCGSSSPQRLDVADASSLQQTLVTVRASAQRHDRGAALAELAAMRARVERLRASGGLSAAEAGALLTDIAHALAAARRELVPPAASPQVVSVPMVRGHGKDHHAGGERG